MLSFFRKNRLLFDWLSLIFFTLGSFFNWYDYFSPEWKKMDLFGGIVFGLMAIFKFYDVIDQYRQKRKLKSKPD